MIVKKMFLLSLVILIVLTSLSSVNALVTETSIRSSLISYWPFAGDATDNVSSNDGSVNGADLTIGRFGVSNEAYYFNGTGDTIDLPNNGGSEFTMSMWINKTFTNYRRCTVKGGGSGSDDFIIVINAADEFGIYLGTGLPSAGYHMTSGANLATNDFSFITWSYNKSLLVMYVDGQKNREVDVSRATDLGTDDIRLARYYGNSAEYFNGTMDEVMVWNRILNATEVSWLYNLTTPFYNIASYTEFDGGANTTDLSLLNSTNKAFNLTIENDNNDVMITWLSSVTLNSTYDLDSAIEISSSFAFVDSSTYTNLNAAANITVFGLSYIGDPFIMKGGAECTDCALISWDRASGTLKFNVTGFSNYSWSDQVLNCFFEASDACPGSTVKLVGVQNDSGGYNNAHGQNYTLGTYPNSVCCNVTNATITINESCAEATIIRLYDYTNSHVQQGNYSAYTHTACLTSDWKEINCVYTSENCTAGSYCVMTLASSEGDNTTNAHIGNCSYYTQKVCCGMQNDPPSAPTLLSPSNNNNTMFNRTLTVFNWTDSTDPEGDSFTYELNIICPSCPATCVDIDVGSISTSNYTLSTELCVDQSYNWTVSACDIYDSCNTSSSFNFTIVSVSEFILIVNSTEFGSMAPAATDDTTDENPEPIVGRNTGNVLLNVSVNATDLFTSVNLNTSYYQFMADENESGSYTAGCSQTTFANMTNTTKIVFCNLSYVDANDEAELELGITLPQNEGSGDRISIITLTPVSLE